MRQGFRKFLAFIVSLALIVTFCAVPVSVSADPANLKFGSDGKFKIVIFSDIQENLNDAKGIARLNEIMTQALAYEQPELVVLLGDQTEQNIKDPEDDFRNLLNQILAPIVNAGVPYAFVFGNHDNQSYYSGQRTDKDAMLAVYRTIGDCRTVDADPSLFGTGTCKIPIYTSNNSAVAFDLFMVDSNTYQNPITGEGGYDNPHADQLAWLAANKDADKNSLVFQHIPMPEIYNFVTVGDGGPKTKNYGGVTYSNSLNGNATGSLGEFPCPPAAENNTGEFTALQNMGGVLGVFTGHDHLNDFTGTYGGINMTAVPGMTYFNYGDEAVRGYGVINLDDDDLSTYDYHSVKFKDIDAATSPYAFNVDFSAGNAIETSGNASYINTASVNANSGSTVTYTFDSTLNRTVARFNGSSGYGYRFSESARKKMQDGYTFEILYKLPAVPSSSIDMASGQYYDTGIRLRYSSSQSFFTYSQSFEGDSKNERVLLYKAGDYGSSIDTDTWIHIVAVWDPDQGKTLPYLNGARVDDSCSPRTKVLKFDANYEYYIGGNSSTSGNYTGGPSCDIAFVRYYDKVYSASEIADLYTEAITPAAGAVDGLYHPYDVIKYGDLRKNNFPLDDEYTFGGGNILTYKATSPTYSSKLKFRWTVGTQLGIQFSFDKRNTDEMSYLFGVWVKKPNNNGAGEYGAWHLRPTGDSTRFDFTSPPAEGDTFDVELGRLKVMENAASHAGQYYIYLKVDDVLIKDFYASASEVNAYGYYTTGGVSCHLSNEIVFDDWGSYGNKISATPEIETFAPYDEIGYEDLHMDNASGALLPTGGTVLKSQNNLFYYAATSPTHSAIYKFRWVAGNDIKFQVHPGTYGSSNNFAYRIYDTNFVQRNPQVNSAIGYTINEGDELILEFARLMVAAGVNAGKYYTYFKVNDSLIFEKYVAADDSNTTPYLEDAVQFNLNDSSHYCYLKPAELEETSAPDALYYAYDEISYGDLRVNGAALSSTTTLGSRLFTYNRTSPTYSAILRYRWKPVVATTKFQISFDRKGAENGINYMFGAQLYAPDSEGHETSSLRLRPGLDDANAWADMNNIVAGEYYNVEFARLKVKNGDNAGKYYVYFKINGELISESYVAANVVDANGNYTSSPGSTACHLSHFIYLTFWGANGTDEISAIPEPETYEDYDEVYYSNLYQGGNPVAAERSGQGSTYTYNKTSDSGSAILKIRWKNANPQTEFQMSFDRKGSSNAINYMFGVQLYKPSDEYPNGRVYLRPGYGPSVAFTEPIQAGQNYDIEFARLKVATGENTGKYYMYIKMNGVLLAESYVAADVVDSEGNYTSKPNTGESLTSCHISNEMYITFWGGGGATITNPAYSETYYDYDEVTYNDFLLGGNPIASSSVNLSSTRTITYNRTSETYSAVIKYRWTAGANAMSGDEPRAYYVFYFDEWSGNSYPFCLAVKGPGQSSLGAAAGANGAWHVDPSVNSHIVQMSEPIVYGANYDIEYARIKVKTGPYKDQYYVYLKVNDALVYGYYYNGDNGDGTYGSGSKIGTFTNTIMFTSSTSSNYISAIPVPEVYADYDELGYHDLLLDGSPLPSRTTALNNKVVFTYNRTSPTYSAVLKYRWIAGDPAKFSLSFDTNNGTATGGESFPFCAVAKYPNQSGYGATAGANGAWQIDPSKDSLLVNMASPLTVGGAYDIEFGRLKVLNGTNAGKYYVYLKVDGVLIQERYYQVNDDGTYSNTCLSNNIVFAVYNSSGNKIRAYGAASVIEHEGVKCDFGGAAGTIDVYDFGVLGDVIIGLTDTSTMAEGIADFNNDGVVDVRDFVAMKKTLSQSNSYAKTGSLALGMQEHLLEDSTKTAAYIADASATLGASVYRLSMPIHSLYDVTNVNGVTVNSTNMVKFKAQISALKAQGINDILYVTDSFILPYGYYNSSYTHHKTVPNPETDTENYIAWLTVNSLAFGELAEECPEIKYFEPFNEINIVSTRLEKYGVSWNASTSEQAAYKYTAQEKAGIMADLCWYISSAVKAVDKQNQVTTPSMCVGSYIGSNLQSNYLNLLYNAIESGGYPTDKPVGDIRIDNYFTIVNIHTYPEYAASSGTRQTNVNTIANDVSAVYAVMQAHNDGGARVWITETGVSINGTRTEANGADLITKYLTKINTNLTFVDTVIFYKIADISASSGQSDVESKYGLFYSGDHATSSYRYAAKQTAKAIYKFFHNGSTDYSALTSLRSRYA